MDLKLVRAALHGQNELVVVVDRFDTMAAACALGREIFYPQVAIGSVAPKRIKRLATRLYPKRGNAAVARIGVLNAVADVSEVRVIDETGQVRCVTIVLIKDPLAPKKPMARISVDGILVATSTTTAPLRRVDRRMPGNWSEQMFAQVNHALRVLACCRSGGLALEKRADGLKTGKILTVPKQPRPAHKPQRKAPPGFRRGCVLFDASGQPERRQHCYVNCEVPYGPAGQAAMYLLVGEKRARQIRRGTNWDRDHLIRIPSDAMEPLLRSIGCEVPICPIARATTVAAAVIALSAIARNRAPHDAEPEDLLAEWLRRHADRRFDSELPRGNDSWLLNSADNESFV